MGQGGETKDKAKYFSLVFISSGALGEEVGSLLMSLLFNLNEPISRGISPTGWKFILLSFLGAYLPEYLLFISLNPFYVALSIFLKSKDVFIHIPKTIKNQRGCFTLLYTNKGKKCMIICSKVLLFLISVYKGTQKGEESIHVFNFWFEIAK